MHLTDFPELRTHRLTLRRLLHSDRRGVFNLRSDVEVLRHLDVDKMVHLTDAEGHIDRVNKLFDEKEAIVWAISQNLVDNFIGSACLFNVNEKELSMELGYELLPVYQKKGYMKESVKAVVSFGFDVLQLNKVYANVTDANEPSKKIITSTRLFLCVTKVDSER